MRRSVAYTLTWLCIFLGLTDILQFDPSKAGFFNWLFHFHQWDARWYFSMAYQGHGYFPQTFVFPPGWGWLLAGVTNTLETITPLNWDESFGLTAFSIGVFSFGLGNHILIERAHIRFQVPKGRAWLGALCNPMGYFAVTSYSDSFFFLLTALTLTAAIDSSERADLWNPPGHTPSRRRIYELAAYLFVSPWIRLTGFAFGIWLFLRRREAWALVASALFFFAYYWIRTDRPLFFLDGQGAFGMPEGGFFTGLSTCIRTLTEGAARIPEVARSPSASLQSDFFIYWVNFGVTPVFVLGFSLLAVFGFAKHREFLIASFLAATLIISHNQAFWRSTPRYAFIVYPLIHILLLAGPKPWRRFTSLGLACVWFCVQIFYARIFRAGGWGF